MTGPMGVVMLTTITPETVIRSLKVLVPLQVIAVVALLLLPATRSPIRDPTLAVRLTGISPVQPDGVALDVVDDELTYFVLGNTSDEPVYALDPGGAPFLEVSADGAFGDINSRYLRVPPKSRPPALVKRPCCPDGRWSS